MSDLKDFAKQLKILRALMEEDSSGSSQGQVDSPRISSSPSSSSSSAKAKQIQETKSKIISDFLMKDETRDERDGRIKNEFELVKKLVEYIILGKSGSRNSENSTTSPPPSQGKFGPIKLEEFECVKKVTRGLFFSFLFIPFLFFLGFLISDFCSNTKKKKNSFPH